MGEEIRSSYIPPDITSMTNEWNEGIQTGETSRVEAMSDVFAWMRGFISGWYGWSNDGKGTFFDFMAVMKAKFDGWKFLMYKQEDMSSHKDGSRIVMDANHIYNNLAWTYTGITPYKHFSKKYFRPLMTLEQYHEAIEWVEKHFFAIYPSDRRYKSVMDDFLFYYEKFGIDCFLIDPFKALVLDDNERSDYVMNKVFIEAKEFALKTNSSFNFISHPKSLTEVKEGKDKDAPYKVVTQFMQLGGSAWDINMDSQYSIYRPYRHRDPADPYVHFYNLKQRKAEIVGVKRGVYEEIKFDYLTKRYFFGGVCPLDGSLVSDKHKPSSTSEELNFSTTPVSDEDLPF